MNKATSARVIHPSKRTLAGTTKRGAPALLLLNIGQLLTLRGPDGPRRGPDLAELAIIKDGAVLCAGGKIVAVGSTRNAQRDHWVKRKRGNVNVIDCRKKVVLPGFVDSHTHPAFISPRLIDFEKRIAGASYEEIAAAGGGIRSSIQDVRGASRERLCLQVLSVLEQMAAHGTTTVEAKSGYGLTPEAELKSLEAIARAARRWPGTLVPTLLGAHVVPPEYAGRSQEYVSSVCTEMIPQAARRKLARFVDVFCDRGAFSAEDAARVFAAGKEQGLGLRAHVGQLSPTSLAPLLRLGPASFDHLDHVDGGDLRLLAQSDTVATLVPGANYFLGMQKYPAARAFIDRGIAVALATDFNPGSSPTPSMAFVLSLACTHMGMSPAEAITAATFNAACALQLAHRKGSIEAGKDADLAVFDVADYREISYWFGTNHCRCTVLGGEVRGRA
jgi:imidazolonepropionase